MDDADSNNDHHDYNNHLHTNHDHCHQHDSTDHDNYDEHHQTAVSLFTTGLKLTNIVASYCKNIFVSNCETQPPASIG